MGIYDTTITTGSGIQIAGSRYFLGDATLHRVSGIDQCDEYHEQCYIIKDTAPLTNSNVRISNFVVSATGAGADTALVHLSIHFAPSATA